MFQPVFEVLKSKIKINGKRSEWAYHKHEIQAEAKDEECERKSKRE